MVSGLYGPTQTASTRPTRQSYSKPSTPCTHGARRRMFAMPTCQACLTLSPQSAIPLGTSARVCGSPVDGSPTSVMSARTNPAPPQRHPDGHPDDTRLGRGPSGLRAKKGRPTLFSETFSSGSVFGNLVCHLSFLRAGHDRH